MSTYLLQCTDITLIYCKLIKRAKNISSQAILANFPKKNKLASDEVGHSRVLIKVGLSFAQVATQQTASSALRTEGLIGPLFCKQEEGGKKKIAQSNKAKRASKHL